MEGMTINAGNVAEIFADIKKKIGDNEGQSIVFNGKMTKCGLLCYDWYKGRGRPRKEDYFPMNPSTGFAQIAPPNNTQE